MTNEEKIAGLIKELREYEMQIRCDRCRVIIIVGTEQVPELEAWLTQTLTTLIHDTEQAARAEDIELLERMKSFCLTNEANGKTGKPSDIIILAIKKLAEMDVKADNYLNH